MREAQPAPWVHSVSGEDVCVLGWILQQEAQECLHLMWSNCAAKR